MLSDNKEMQERASVRRRSVHATTNMRWSDSQKLEAIKTYLILGNLAQTAVVLKIPEETLRQWKRKEWWQEACKEMASQENLILSNKLKKIVERSLELMGDRLENGDFYYDQKQGKMLRKPVPLRELNKVAADMLTHHGKIKTEEHVVVAEEQINDKLTKLAQQFEQFATKQLDTKAPVVVTDVIFAKSPDNDDLFAQEEKEE